jgi:predicted esterase
MLAGKTVQGGGMVEIRFAVAKSRLDPPEKVPVWLSSGTGDTVATPQSHDLVRISLERTDFKRVRLERFAGQHQLKMSEVRRALRWFRELGKF